MLNPENVRFLRDNSILHLSVVVPMTLHKFRAINHYEMAKDIGVKKSSLHEFRDIAQWSRCCNRG